MLTDRLITRIGSLRGLSPLRMGSFGSVSSAPPGSAKIVPAFQMDYTITETDTLERVAASHDCTVGELMKLNKMASRMVFPGQKILVPLANSDDVFDPPSSTSSLKSSGNQISGIENAEDGIRKGPGGAVPAHVRRGSFSKAQSAPIPRGSNEEADTDCLQRFLKIKVKQVTESDGTVSGTLLVTPNCLMFDPDVSHPLVKENGPDLYGMVANMDEIQSVSVYKEISGLTGDKEEKKRDIFDPEHLRTPEDSPKKEVKNQEEIDIPKNGEVQFEAGSVDSNHSPKFGSDIALPAISEETKDSPCDEHKGNDSRTRAATLGDEEVQMRARSRSRTSSQASSNDERPRSFSELDTPSEGKNIGRFSPNAARRSFGKLGRTLSARAKSIQGTVTSGAEKVVGTAVQGTKTVAHGVVTHTKSAADTLQSGIENGAKAAADVAGRVVDKGQSLMSESINGVQEIFSVPDFEQPAKSPMAMKREQSLAKLQDLRRQTAEARENSAKENRASVFACATSSDEMPHDLLADVDQIIERSRIQSNDSTASQPLLPFYMAVRLTRNKKKKKSSTSSPSYDEDIAFGNKLKREFWFAVPRSQADNIYHFLLQWSPDKYGLDTTAGTNEEQPSVVMVSDGSADKGFIVLGSNADESLGVCSTLCLENIMTNRGEQKIEQKMEITSIKSDESDKKRGRPPSGEMNHQGAGNIRIKDSNSVGEMSNEAPSVYFIILLRRRHIENLYFVDIYQSFDHFIVFSSLFVSSAWFKKKKNRKVLYLVILIFKESPYHRRHVFRRRRCRLLLSFRYHRPLSTFCFTPIIISYHFLAKKRQ